MRDRADRRLATVLFVDIVDSTRIASDVGDRRWRELLGSFRRAVRRRLRAGGGHEQDTAGDGFFATFDRPAAAIRAAVGIIEDAQALGLDARCGLHTGELERIDRHLGGIAAHIGARVMALAQPAEVLVTGTVHDLVVGGGIAFARVQETELRGVPGRWTLYRVAEVDGRPRSSSLAAAEATLRIGAGATQRPAVRPHPRMAVLAVAAVGALAITALGAVVLTLPRDNPSLASDPSPPAGRPPSMIRIDPTTNEVVEEVYDSSLAVWTDAQVLIVDGALWQETPVDMVRRDLETGEVVDVIKQPSNTRESFFAFGSLWFASVDRDSGLGGNFHRVDPLSGRAIAEIQIDRSARSIAVGRDAIYFLTSDEVVEIDPSVNEIVDRDPHGFGTVPDTIGSVGGSLWICECDEARITQWDPDSDTAVRTVEFAQRGFILDDQRELSQGYVAIEASTVWLMDGGAGTITPVDTRSGDAGQPIGIPRGSGLHVFGLGSVWISAPGEIYRLELDTLQGESIPLPAGVNAGGLAVDEETGAVWVANLIAFGEPIPRPIPES